MQKPEFVSEELKKARREKSKGEKES